MNKSTLQSIKKYQNFGIFLALAVFSFILMYICTSSSPRYAINPWVDSNAFFTVGKGMAHGLIPYKDLFEHKGPLLYFIHCLSYLISRTSFTGVYIFEALSMSTVMFFTYKSGALYLNKITALITAVLTGFITANSFCLYYGDSAEEFCLPTMAAGLYYLLKYFKEKDENNLSRITYLVCGMLAGCVFMIKYSVIGFWFGWMAVLALHTLTIKKDTKNAFKNSFLFLGGMFLAVIPWIIYFAVNNGLKDFIETYFIINTKAYNTGKESFFNIFSVIQRFYRDAYFSKPLAVVSALSVVFSVFTSIIFGKKIIARFSVPVVFACTVFLAYCGRNISYYFLIFAAFVPITVIAVFSFAEQLFADKKYFKASVSVILALSVALSVFVSLKTNINSRFTVRNPEDTSQYKISKYIEQHNPEGALLNLGFLDGGFSVFGDMVPSLKHFEQQNIPKENYSENYDEQTRYYTEGIADYVVVRTIDVYPQTPEELYPELYKKYRLVMKVDDIAPTIDVKKYKFIFSYYLFEKI